MVRSLLPLHRLRVLDSFAAASPPEDTNATGHAVVATDYVGLTAKYRVPDNAAAGCQ